MIGSASICAISLLWRRSHAHAPSAAPRASSAIPSRPSASRSRSSSGSWGSNSSTARAAPGVWSRRRPGSCCSVTPTRLSRVSTRSELAKLEAAPPLREIAKLPLIGRRTTDEPERFLAGRVPELNVIFRTDDNGTLGALVAEDLGAAIEPRLVVDPRDRAVKMLPFGSRIPPRTLVLAWHRDRYRSQAAEAFVELARELAIP